MLLYVHCYSDFLDMEKPAIFGFSIAFISLLKLPKRLNTGFFNLKKCGG